MHIDNRLPLMEWWPETQNGWRCPKCGTIYSPTVYSCWSCSNNPPPTIPQSPWIKPWEDWVRPQDFPWNKEPQIIC